MTSEVEKENKELARQVEALQQRLDAEIKHRQEVEKGIAEQAHKLQRANVALYQLISNNKLMYGTLGQIQMALVQNSGLVIGNMKLIEPFYNTTLDQAIEILNTQAINTAKQQHGTSCATT